MTHRMVREADAFLLRIDGELALNELVVVEKVQLPSSDALTARGLAHLWVGTDEVWATPKQWKRAKKRALKLGLFAE